MAEGVLNLHSQDSLLEVACNCAYIFYGINIQMPSIGNTIRQIPRETAFYNYEDTDIIVYCKFVPAPGNYVGNYSPGYMTPIDMDEFDYLKDRLNVLRDFGKTITNAVLMENPPTDSGIRTRFRHIQILSPTGDVKAATFPSYGVIGSDTIPNGDSKYFNLYIPIPIEGRGYTPLTRLIAGGSM